MKNKSQTSIDDCKMISLPKIENPSGNISPIHGGIDIPFEIKRVFYLYDIPGGEIRGGHAHRECQQLLIAGSGSFDVEIDDGNKKRTFRLDRPYLSLYVPPGIWATEKIFSSGSICLVLASDFYSETDYIRVYKEYLNFKLEGI